MRVMAIEGDDAVSRAVTQALQREGFSVEVARSGEEGVDLAKRYDFDIIVLDQVLPDISGFEALKRLRAAKVATPLLMLSTDSTAASHIRSLELGADDVVTVPFHGGELAARLRAIVRRSLAHPHSVITTGKLTINLDTKRVEADGTEISLTGTEYRLLELFCLRRGITLEKDRILDHLYGGLDEPAQRIVDVFVCKLRRKLAEATQGDNYITTVWGRGYTFGLPAARVAAAA